MNDDDDFIIIDRKLTIQMLQELVKKNEYIKNSKTIKDPFSIAYLVKYDISSNDYVKKLGTGIEKLLIDIVKHYNTDLEHVKDHIFIDNTKKIIYYGELKANINLDIEKTKTTCKKCLNIVKDLQKEFADYTIKWSLVSYRYIDNDSIPTIIKNKYIKIAENLYGINEYLEMLGINFEFTEDSYNSYVNAIADEIFIDKN